MDVLRVVGDYYPFVMGGLPLHVRNLSYEQARKGINVTVMTFGTAATPDRERLKVKVYIRYLVAFGNRLSLGFIGDLFKEVRKHDLVHAHSHLYLVSNLAALFSKIRGVPFIITNHGFYSQSMSMLVQKIFLKTVTKYSMAIADSIICYTEDEKQVLIDHGVDRNRIRVIHNGISTEEFHPNPSESKDIDLLWVGRLVRGKDPMRFIETVHALKERFPEIRALMIGDGPLSKDVRDGISLLDLRENITLMEKIENDEIPNFYRRSRILIITSHFEGVPRTSLEAMSCGIPVVSTHIPQLRDVLGDAGVVIGEGEELPPPIVRILENTELRETMGTKGRERVVRGYSWEDTVNRINALYDEILEARANR